MSNSIRTYCTFQAKDNKSSKIIEYRIQDLPDDRFDEAIDLLCVHFLPDEPMTLCRNLHGNENDKKEICKLLMEIMKQGLSIVCFRNDGGDDVIVGVNLLTVKCRDEVKSCFEHQGLNDICEALTYTFNQADIFNRYNIDKYLGSFCLVVNRSYRNCGIAKEILKSRRFVMQKLGLDVTATAFSGPGSQKAAEGAGYEDIYSISYEDLKKISPNFDFINKMSNVFKIKVLKL
ncbi:uncharacterized protein [Chironomus tepperi]|uniref:uncharacterized protein n=1 Tax=Chironomus tepperi TaxID=113505 RepID=UPI00391F09F4